MPDVQKRLGITELVLRDGHQSLLATRMRLEDMLPIAGALDRVGYWSVESWGGATFDACIRYLGEDPWERLRALKQAMPNTRQQMLLRGQNLLGYRHYADDVVERFVERAALNGVDVFRVFDAMNDPRNLQAAIRAVKATGRHAQGTLCYTTSPVHTLDGWVDYARTLEDMGADSICIKDMAGILRPYEAFDLVSRLKHQTALEVQLHSHATSGLAGMTLLKAIEAGVDRVDTAISSMSMTYSHTATETVVAALVGQARATGLDLARLRDIANHFRRVRKKYAKFEGTLRGTDARILLAQVPGGMLTNLESQLREQDAADRFDEVLAEIPRVREDLGLIPLVTPTSQIVGTQAVINVLTGARYSTVSREVQAILRGEYGAAPAPVDRELQAKVLQGEAPIVCRPADRLEPELERLGAELREQARSKGIRLATGDNEIDDVLTCALFPQVGLRFLENRGKPEAFEPLPGADETPPPAAATTAPAGPEIYTLTVNGRDYVVRVSEGGNVSDMAPATTTVPAAAVEAEAVTAPLAGTVFRVQVAPGQAVQVGDVLVVLEAMKMETEIRASRAGEVRSIDVREGDAVHVGDPLLRLG